DRGHVDAGAEVLLVAKAGAHHPAHQLASCPPGEGTCDVALDRPGRLSDEQDSLPGVTAEDGTRTGDATGVHAARARAVRRLQPLQRLAASLGRCQRRSPGAPSTQAPRMAASLWLPRQPGGGMIGGAA